MTLVYVIYNGMFIIIISLYLFCTHTVDTPTTIRVQLYNYSCIEISFLDIPTFICSIAFNRSYKDITFCLDTY